MVGLTNSKVATAQLGDRERVIWDGLVPGFGVRIHPGGRRTYMLVYRVGGGRAGRRRTLTLGLHGAIDCKEARRQAREAHLLAVKGVDPAGEKLASRLAPTVSALCDRFLELHARPHKRARSVEEDERNMRNHVRPLLGSLKVTAVTCADVDAAINAIRDGKTARNEKTVKHGRRIVRGGVAAANRTLALLKTMFTLAERWGLRPPASNPCRNARKYPERPRERFLSLDELQRVAAALADAGAKKGGVSASARAAIRLLLFTGCRVSEILTLRWGQVDLERGVARLAESKTGPKSVYLNAPARAVLGVLLGERKPKASDYILPGEGGEGHLPGLKSAWSSIRRRAALPDVRLHDLRHTFASMGAADHSMFLLGKLLGHRNVSTTARYAHLAADPVQQAAETIGRRIAGAMGIVVTASTPRADAEPTTSQLLKTA